VRAHLPGVDLVGAEVVGDRGERRGVGVQRDRRVRLPVGAEPADQLGREVLGLRRRPAVAAGQQPAPGREHARELAAPGADRGGVAVDPGQGRAELLQMRVHGYPPSAARRLGCPSITCVYTASVCSATRGQPYRSRARRAPALPISRPLSGLSSSSFSALASALGLRGGTSSPHPATVSRWPPTADATTGTPHAIASTGTIPNGSYHGTVTSTSAARMRAGTRSRGTLPITCTRSASP